MENNTMAEKKLETQPIQNPKRINIAETAPGVTISFTEEQYQKLRQGLKPKEMEDKWYICFENDWLHFYRSWTGDEIMRAPIIKEDSGSEGVKYAIKEFYVEIREGGSKDGDDELDIAVLRQLIYWGLLGIDIRNDFIQKYGSENSGSIMIWSLFGRMFFPE